MLPSVELLQLLLIFSLGIAYATQTRIKIGAQTWGYQIETNQGRDVRTEFASPDGIIVGSFIYKLGDETKKLEYRIDPNRMEPDIGFNVTTVQPNNQQQIPPRDGRRFTEAEDTDSALTNSTSSNDNEIEKDVVTVPNVSFDSIDSKQDFKGHVSLKVANRSYVINFVTGDKSNSREESLTSAGMLLGRLNFMGKNTLTKLVINYKFNTTSPEPTFEVSLYRTLESESSDTSRGYNPSFYNRDALPHNQQHHHHSSSNHHHREPMSRDSYRDRLTYYNPRSYSPSGSGSTSSSSPYSSSQYSSPYSSNVAQAIPMSPAVKQQQFLAEKYRPAVSRDDRYRDRSDRDRSDRDRVDRDRDHRPEPIYRAIDRSSSSSISAPSSQSSQPSAASPSSSPSPSSVSSSSSPSSSRNDQNERSREESLSNDNTNTPQQPSWYYPSNRNKIYDP